MQAWFGVQSQQWQWSCFWCSTSLLAYEVVPSAFTSLSLERLLFARLPIWLLALQLLWKS